MDRVVRRKNLPDFKSRQAWLRTECGFGGNEAGWLAEYSQGRHTWDFDPDVYLMQAAAFVEAQFAGPKASLRPTFEAVLALARGLGPDVRICPCKTIVPIYRHRVFAELKPATRTRLELSFALGETPFAGDLVPNPRAKGNDRLRHQLHLTADGQLPATVRKWLTAAYRMDA
jgi:hypothetical protein